MKYLLMICDDESSTPSPEELAADPVMLEWERNLRGRDALKAGGRLRPVHDATSVRVRQNETLVSDGPFAETKDFIGGFAVVECADLDEAIAVAAGHPWAHRGVVEIRPIWE